MARTMKTGWKRMKKFEMGFGGRILVRLRIRVVRDRCRRPRRHCPRRLASRHPSPVRRNEPSPYLPVLYSIDPPGYGMDRFSLLRGMKLPFRQLQSSSHLPPQPTDFARRAENADRPSAAASRICCNGSPLIKWSVR